MEQMELMESNLDSADKRYEKTIISEYRIDNFFNIQIEDELEKIIKKNKKFFTEPKKISKKYAKFLDEKMNLILDCVGILLTEITVLEAKKLFKELNEKVSKIETANPGRSSPLTLFNKYNKKNFDDSKVKITFIIKYDFFLHYQSNWEEKMRSCDTINAITKNKKKREKFREINERIIQIIKMGIQFEEKYRDYLLKDNFQSVNHYDRQFLAELLDLIKIMYNAIIDLYKFYALFSKKKQKKLRGNNLIDNDFARFSMNIDYRYKQER